MQDTSAYRRLQTDVLNMLKPASEGLPTGSQDPVQWMEKHYYIPETYAPIVLVPYQKAVLREAARRDAKGEFVYSIIVWGDIKKSAKSSIAAAQALFRAVNTPWSSCKIVANDLKQADTRVNYYMRRAITLNPSLRGIRQRGNTTNFPNNSQVEAIPIDPGGEAGGTDHLIIFSELWAAKHKAMKQMWTEMTLSPTLFGHSQRWVETYAGYAGESPILEQLFELKNSAGAEKLDLSFADDDGTFHDLRDLGVWAVDRTLLMWNDVPRCPWQTKAYYAQEAAILQPTEFQRVHRNEWQTSTEVFVPPEWWDQCAEPAGTFYPDSLPVNIGMDAGISDDMFAMVATSEYLGNTIVREIRAWKAEPGKKIDFALPEAELYQWIAKYRVNDVRYDPYQLHDMGTRLKNKHLVNVVEFGQGGPRLRADKQLYDRIKGARIRHKNDPTLSEHVKNANAQKTGDNRLRIVKRTQEKKVDLAVALSMSAYNEDGITEWNSEQFEQVSTLNDVDSKWGDPQWDDDQKWR